MVNSVMFDPALIKTSATSVLFSLDVELNASSMLLTIDPLLQNDKYFVIPTKHENLKIKSFFKITK